jgi:hypothetical protein
MPPDRFRIPDQPDPRALGLTWPELLAAYDAFAALVTERRMHLIRRANLEDDRRRAVSGDRSRYAKALRDGKPDPGAKATEKVDAEIAGTLRRLDALELAIDEANAALGRVIDEHRAQWLVETDERITAERSDYCDVIDALAKARTELLTSHAVARWLEAYPARFHPSADLIHGLPTPNQEPFAASLVLDALRADGEPVAERVAR